MQHSVGDRAFFDLRRVLRFLLLGMDPETDKPVMEAALASPEAREALASGIEGLKDSPSVQRWRAAKRVGLHLSWEAKRSRGGEAPLPTAIERSGVGWSLQEDRQIAREFAEGQNLTMMATNHQRSRGSILARLMHLGLRKQGA